VGVTESFTMLRSGRNRIADRRESPTQRRNFANSVAAASFPRARSRAGVPSKSANLSIGETLTYSYRLPNVAVVHTCRKGTPAFLSAGFSSFLERFSNSWIMSGLTLLTSTPSREGDLEVSV